MQYLANLTIQALTKYQIHLNENIQMSSCEQDNFMANLLVSLYTLSPQRVKLIWWGDYLLTVKWNESSEPQYHACFVYCPLQCALSVKLIAYIKCWVHHVCNISSISNIKVPLALFPLPLWIHLGNCVSCTHNSDSFINFDFYWGNVSFGEHSKDLSESEAKINTLWNWAVHANEPEVLMLAGYLHWSWQRVRVHAVWWGRTRACLGPGRFPGHILVFQGPEINLRGIWELDYKESWAQKNWCFELWCWRRLLRVPWTARRSNQSILKETSPGCSLERLMLKLKLQYFGHLMRRVDSLEKTLMLGKKEEKGTTEDEMAGWHHRLDGQEFGWTLGVGDGQGGLACYDSWDHKESDMAEWLNWTELMGFQEGEHEKHLKG